MGGAKHRVWQGAAAYVAAIAMLFRALLVPAGCTVPADARALDGFAAVICSVHAGGSDTPQPGDAPGKTSHHHTVCTSTTCCAFAVPAAAPDLDLLTSGKSAFALEIWRAPEGAASLVPRNRGPPLTLSA
jgi:hypothetical protein